MIIQWNYSLICQQKKNIFSRAWSEIGVQFGKKKKISYPFPIEVWVKNHSNASSENSV